jgi:hypothetical protein
MNITNWAVNRSGTDLHQLAYEYFFYDNLQTSEYIPGSFQEVARRNPKISAWTVDELFAWSALCPRAHHLHRRDFV